MNQQQQQPDPASLHEAVRCPGDEPSESQRLGELLDSNSRLCDLIYLGGVRCLQPWWSEWHWERLLAELAELVPPNGDGNRGDYELVRDHVRTQIDLRQFGGSHRSHTDDPEYTNDF